MIVHLESILDSATSVILWMLGADILTLVIVATTRHEYEKVCVIWHGERTKLPTELGKKWPPNVPCIYRL